MTSAHRWLSHMSRMTSPQPCVLAESQMMNVLEDLPRPSVVVVVVVAVVAAAGLGPRRQR